VSKSGFDRGSFALKKFLRVKPLSTEDLYRLYDEDRPSLETRKTPLADLIKTPLPPELVDWAGERSSQAILAAADVLENRSVGAREQARFGATLDLLETLCGSRPDVLRPVILPAVRALRHARQRNDQPTAARLERFLLRVSGTAPAIVVSGTLLAGNPRYRGTQANRRKGGGTRRNKASMVRAIRRAAVELHNDFAAPARERLIREGYKPMVERLDLILKAVHSVVEAASSKSDADDSARRR